MYLIERYHDISCGHRVVGHETKCRLLHGHNYRIHFTCQAEQLDSVGRVIDFGVIKSTLCQWLEDFWDHRLLLWVDDPLFEILPQDEDMLRNMGIVAVPFNPTAENLAQYLVDIVGPALLLDTGVTLMGCRVEETRKCSAAYQR